jgi:hypothetical protein
MEPDLAALERYAADNPADSQGLVRLANAYWLSGHGPDVVHELASRAIAADPENRGAWHMWAISESSPRERVSRWRQVVQRFPEDQLARANLADNAASLAGAEADEGALALAIVTYEELLSSAETAEQREAVGNALRALRGWRL